MNTGAANGDTALRAVNARPDLHAAPATPVGKFHDLGQRVLSALVLAPAGVGAALAGGPWLAAACAAAAIAMAWEWARMSERATQPSALVFLAAGAVGAIMIASLGQIALALSWLGACAIASALRRELWVGRAETAFGLIYIGAPCVLFLWLRAHESGLELILFLFAAIWAADIFAYLGGTVIGGPRLHVALSPQKTWSGIVAGVLAGGGAGAFFATFRGHENLVWLATIAALLAFIGLIGDLFESHLKRRFGVKDASGLIPGHGGVLDRIDGLMAATLAAAIALAIEPSLIGLLR